MIPSGEAVYMALVLLGGCGLFLRLVSKEIGRREEHLLERLEAWTQAEEDRRLVSKSLSEDEQAEDSEEPAERS